MNLKNIIEFCTINDNKMIQTWSREDWVGYDEGFEQDFIEWLNENGVIEVTFINNSFRKETIGNSDDEDILTANDLELEYSSSFS